MTLSQPARLLIIVLRASLPAVNHCGGALFTRNDSISRHFPSRADVAAPIKERSSSFSRHLFPSRGTLKASGWQIANKWHIRLSAKNMLLKWIKKRFQVESYHHQGTYCERRRLLSAVHAFAIQLSPALPFPAAHEYYFHICCYYCPASASHELISCFYAAEIRSRLHCRPFRAQYRLFIYSFLHKQAC